MTRNRLPVLGSLALALAGCAVGPDYHAPAAADLAGPAAPAAAAPASGWWTALRDPELDRIVGRALRGNLDLQAAAARVAAARAARNSTAGTYYPSLAAGGDVSRNAESPNGEILAAAPRGLPNTYTDFRAGFDASWELDLFGHTRRAVEAADARLGSAVEGRRAAELAVGAEAASLYIEYRIDQERLAVLGRSIALEETTLGLVRDQLSAGTASELDVDRAESDWRQSRAGRPSLQADASATLLSLGVLAGDTPAALASELEGTEAPVPAPGELGPEPLPSDLVRRRPDLRQAERELAAATADIGVAVADQFPRFSLLGSAGLDSVRSGSFAEAASRYWAVGPSFSVPLFQGGALRSQVQQREALRDQALAAYRQAVLSALADVETALLRLRRERERLADLDAGWAASQRAVELASSRYRAGDTALTDVLDVERQLNALADERAQSRGLLALDWVALQKALGGGPGPG